MDTHKDDFTGQFLSIMANAKRKTDERRQQERLVELVGIIDELAAEMGSAAFRDAVRKAGYDIDACAAMLAVRGVDIN